MTTHRHESSWHVQRGRGVRVALAGFLLALFASLLMLTATARADPAESVTIHASEFFGADGDQSITVSAGGGVFGTQSSGSGFSDQFALGSETSLLQSHTTVYHGVDVYQTSAGDAHGSFTFSWQFTCVYTSDIHSVCTGPWHITDATGDYQDAKGGGSAEDQCDDEYNGPDGAYSGTRCEDTLVGTMRVP
jgi:hypothetical protein